jgi:hypothetical protein
MTPDPGEAVECSGLAVRFYRFTATGFRKRRKIVLDRAGRKTLADLAIRRCVKTSH